VSEPSCTRGRAIRWSHPAQSSWPHSGHCFRAPRLARKSTRSRLGRTGSHPDLGAAAFAPRRDMPAAGVRGGVMPPSAGRAVDPGHRNAPFAIRARRDDVERTDGGRPGITRRRITKICRHRSPRSIPTARRGRLCAWTDSKLDAVRMAERRPPIRCGRGRLRLRFRGATTLAQQAPRTQDAARPHPPRAVATDRTRGQASIAAGRVGRSTSRAETTKSGFTQMPSTVSIHEVLALVAHRSISVRALPAAASTWRFSPVVSSTSMNVGTTQRILGPWTPAAASPLSS